MKRTIAGKNPGRKQLSDSYAWGRALMGALFLGFLFLADHAQAGITYRLAGGECTDGNRPEIFYPDAGASGAFGPGPTLCANQILAQITVHDGYVPGSPFMDVDQPGATLTVQSFSFTDNARPVQTTFPPAGSGGSVTGVLPAGLAPTDVDIFWFEGWFFQTRSDGTWMFGEEFGAGDAPCGPGSIEGPNLSGDACKVTPHYFALGTYDGWIQVTEPPTLMAAALALALMGGLGWRRRQAMGRR